MGNDPKPRGKRDDRKSLFRTNGAAGDGGGYNWGKQECGYILALIDIVTSRGGAIRFGNTRDGGAGSVGVYYRDSRDTVYIRPGQDIEDALGVIERTFQSLPDTGGRSPDA